MSGYPGPDAHRSESVAGTLRLLAYLAFAITLMVLDLRGGWMARLRAGLDHLAEPVWQLAGLPGRLGKEMRQGAVTRGQLIADNTALRNALLINGARLARLEAAQAENTRLRALLGAIQREQLDVRLARVLDIDLDPTRQRLLLDAGARDGVQQGQVVLDAGGVLGQVTEVRAMTSTVVLLTDPDHAVPVEVARTGVRLVAQGRGNAVVVVNIPRETDIHAGDVVQTSGLGGRFPAGFPVGTVRRLHPDDSRAFLEADLQPAGQLDRGHEVLLLRNLPAPALMAPASPAPVAAVPAATPAGPAAAATAAPASATGATR